MRCTPLGTMGALGVALAWPLALLTPPAPASAAPPRPPTAAAKPGPPAAAAEPGPPAAAAEPGPPAAAAPTAPGTVSGRVSLDGKPEGRVIVYVEQAADAPATSAPAPRVVQRNTAFDPRSVVVAQNQRVYFPNEDKFHHNVFSVTPGNEFDLGLYRGGHTRWAVLRKAGEVDVFCNIHPGMAMKILVLQNKYYAAVAANGTYTIAGVPPGKYTLVAWAASHAPVKREIQVNGGAVKVDFSLKRRDEPRSHLNKGGEQYGRYK